MKGHSYEKTSYPKIESTAQTDAWFPSPNADTRWPADPRPKASKGAPGPGSLRRAAHSSPPAFVLAALCREGIRVQRGSWVLYGQENHLGKSRIKLSLPRLRPKRSVLRNRYRRRMREALRQLTSGGPGWDFFLISRRLPQQPFTQLQKEIKELLRAIGYG